MIFDGNDGKVFKIINNAWHSDSAFPESKITDV